jgi:hypothetical protein
VLASRPQSRPPPTLKPHNARCPAGAKTSRDFVPWRFLDAGELSERTVSLLLASKNQHISGNRGFGSHDLHQRGRVLLGCDTFIDAGGGSGWRARTEIARRRARTKHREFEIITRGLDDEIIALEQS